MISDDLVEASGLARECWRSSTNCYGDDDDQRDMTMVKMMILMVRIGKTW